MARILFVNGEPEEYLQVKAAIHRVSDDLSVSYVASGDHLFNLLPYFTPDLLFIDISHEHQHGVSCFHKIRANNQYNNLPIFLYCTESQWSLVREGDSSPINYHVAKSTAIEKIRISIKNALEKYQDKDLAARETSAALAFAS